MPVRWAAKTMLRRMAIVAALAPVATGVIVIGASRLSDAILASSGTTMQLLDANPRTLLCMLTEPPIDSESEAACVAFHHLASEIESDPQDYRYSAGLDSGVWHVTIHDPRFTRGGAW